jgi:hypothetical protein
MWYSECKTKNNKSERNSFGSGTPAFFKPVVQAKLSINQPNDAYEQEADVMAERVMNNSNPTITNNSFFAPAISSIQRKCKDCEDERHVQRKENSTAATEVSTAGENYLDSLSGGIALNEKARSFFEPRMGYDFSNVKIHTDNLAAKSAQSINALAYTFGSNIVFNNGQYSPETDAGKRLLAHELTHVIQQGESIQTKLIQRDCDDSDFCTPYPTTTEAAAAKANLRSYYLPAEEAKFGSNSRALFESYLSRRPGDSLAPVVFNNPSSDVVTSFSDSWSTSGDQDAVIDLVGNRLSRAPGWPLHDYTPTMMSLANFLSTAEMNNRPINYGNPFSIAGHIAGGIGSSDAGPDYRKINYANVTLEKIPIIRGTGYISVEVTPQYEVFDAVDFCPGDCGSPAEQLITIPMSRLEAGGEAYDVPFQVNFTPESRSKRFWY